MTKHLEWCKEHGKRAKNDEQKVDWRIKMNNDYVIDRKLDELIRQQKITNVYLKELAEQGIRASSVVPRYYIDKLQNEVYKQ